MTTTKLAKKINWNEVKQDYLADFEATYSSLAKKYGISVTRVEVHGSREGWVKQRQDIGKKTNTEFNKKLVSENVEASLRHRSQYKNMQALGMNMLIDFHSASSLNPSNFYQIVKAIDISIKGERNVLGIKTENLYFEPEPFVFDIMGSINE
jgi:hypothetical protein